MDTSAIRPLLRRGMRAVLGLALALVLWLTLYPTAGAPESAEQGGLSQDGIVQTVEADFDF